MPIKLIMLVYQQRPSQTGIKATAHPKKWGTSSANVDRIWRVVLI